MLKRIKANQLRVGMYLHELCGSWLEHPFWRSSFLISNEKELERIVQSGVREAWIDTARGLDVAPEVAPQAVSKQESDRRTDQQLAGMAAGPLSFERCSMAEEVKRATSIRDRTRDAVASMFSEARMGRALDASDAVPLVEEISASVSRNQGALISLARLKSSDDYTYMHSVAVCALMIALGRQLRLDEGQVRDAGLAGLLHDIGKMYIPPEILNKPGRLTDAEFNVVRAHPEAGHRMLLEGEGVSKVALDVCLHHHEKMDGSGYPHKLAGDEISLFARMGAVCDVYDAITSDRPYKRGWDPAESLRKMTEWCKGHFDEAIFHAFVRSLGIYPIGSLVRLHSGRIAVVVEQSPASLLAPDVTAFYSTKHKARFEPKRLELSNPATGDGIASREDPSVWNFPDLERLWMGSVGMAA
ncbi:MAG TPA: HD-GYP domain-containing protein [Rhodocyclaceae bacterium]|nr:HD-GYP domain-containing protein [Rhodocyclaceae bacterium]